MHFLAISLLSILAGTLLLAKFRKEAAGKLFTCISWFFIVVGFILFIGFTVGGICKMSRCCAPGKTECNQEMMMKHRGPMGGCGPMKNCSQEMMGGCCDMKGMDKGMCSKHGECMPKDSTMKCCDKKMECDSAKMQMMKK
jgi:hypothetical protein